MSVELINMMKDRAPVYWGKSDDLCLSVPDKDKVWEPKKQEWEPLKTSEERREEAEKKRFYPRKNYAADVPGCYATM